MENSIVEQGYSDFADMLQKIKESVFDLSLIQDFESNFTDYKILEDGATADSSFYYGV